jgi:hypothetical protein
MSALDRLGCLIVRILAAFGTDLSTAAMRRR